LLTATQGDRHRRLHGAAAPHLEVEINLLVCTEAPEPSFAAMMEANGVADRRSCRAQRRIRAELDDRLPATGLNRRIEAGGQGTAMLRVE
jgi:hypothetical protein